MPPRKPRKKKQVKERIPIAPPSKVIPNPKKEEEKKKCRQKVEDEADGGQ